MFRAMEDDLCASARQPRPAIWNAPHVIGPRCLKAAWAKGTLAIGEVRPMLAPRSDNHMRAGERVNTKVRLTHECTHRDRRTRSVPTCHIRCTNGGRPHAEEAFSPRFITVERLPSDSLPNYITN